MFKIGVDFDNTIACYDYVFAKEAMSQGVILDSFDMSKLAVKNKILLQPKGDLNWQKLQGQIYGEFMHKASVFPGFAEFLLLAKLRGHQVYIISHKTEFGHFDTKKVSLPVEAMKWLVAKQFVGSKLSMIQKEDVFFEPTRELKIERIKLLGCTHFIDDLEEVLNEPIFPDKTKKYLFNYSNSTDLNNLTHLSGSWRSITKQILGDWTENDVYLVVRDIFPDIQVEKVELKKGRGNSKIYKLTASDNKSYALKVYPDLQLDSRKRLETEFSACQLLSEENFPVVKAVAKNESINWAVYTWIDGEIETANETFINKSLEFVRRLISFSHIQDNVKIFSNASEACLTGLEIVRQIQNRYDRLILTDYKELNIFLIKEFLPIFENSIRVAKKLMKNQFNKSLSEDLLIVSPSDFGAHNAIRGFDEQTYFIDFEYLGWDDPVKLACDFYWHPAMNINDSLQTIWMKKIKSIFDYDGGFETRITAYLPLFGLRWCLIMLNEFLPDKIAQRIHANHEKENRVADLQEMQFTKSKNILEIIKTNLNYG